MVFKYSMINKPPVLKANVPEFFYFPESITNWMKLSTKAWEALKDHRFKNRQD